MMTAMMENFGQQELFESLLALTGKKIEVGLSSTGEIFSGTLVYTMFDSFLIEISGKNRVVRFVDLLFLNPT